MSEDRESLWHELLDHPAWKEVQLRLSERRKLASSRLEEIAAVSSDPLVAAVAHEIREIDAMLNLPEEELASARERSAGS